MTRFHAEQRIQAVKRYLDGIESQRDIAKSIGVSHVVLSGWIRLYEEQGPAGFFKLYTNYSTAFKMDVLSYMSETGISSIDAAAIFNIPSPGLIREWRKRFEIGGSEALVSKKKGRPSMTKEKN